MARRVTQITVTPHALKRHFERAGPITSRRLAREVRRSLLSALRVGVYPDFDLGVHIEIPEGLVAIVTPNWEGGWAVLTVYTVDERKEWVG